MRKNQINKHTNKLKKLSQMDKKPNKQNHEQNLSEQTNTQTKSIKKNP